MPDLSQTLRTAFTRVLNRRTAVRRGRLDVVPDFESRILGNQRQLTIYVPPGYDDRPERRYPVLYMQDGQNLFDDFRAVGGNSWRLRDAPAAAIGGGDAPAEPNGPLHPPETAPIREVPPTLRPSPPARH